MKKKSSKKTSKAKMISAKNNSSKRKQPGIKSMKTKSSKSNNQQKSETRFGDIASLILRDHKPIKELILILKDPEVSLAKKQPAFEEFEKTLLTHAKAEEESLYIHLKKINNLRQEGLEGDIEHNLTEQLMSEINESSYEEDVWMAKVKVLAELVDHHVKEEENEVLKEVRKDFSSGKRMEIGELYSQLLNKYRSENEGLKQYNFKDDIRAEYV